jgi:hypothetical protein
MVLIETLLLKMTLDGILQYCNDLKNKQDLLQETRQLKSQLSKLMIDYETGNIDQDTYRTKELQILSKLNAIKQQYDI